MSSNKAVWHPPFTGLLQERGPRWTKTSGEVSRTVEPQRADDLIEVRGDPPRDPSDVGSVLRRLRSVWIGPDDTALAWTGDTTLTLLSDADGRRGSSWRPETVLNLTLRRTARVTRGSRGPR